MVPCGLYRESAVVRLIVHDFACFYYRFFLIFQCSIVLPRLRIFFQCHMICWGGCVDDTMSHLP
jgi:hypothetical protein